MTSPNVQIQNLLRRYVREKEGNISMNMVIDKLLTPPTPTHNIGQLTPESQADIYKLNLAIPFMLQTAYLTNFKPSFEYVLTCNFLDESTQGKYSESTEVDDIFEMDEFSQGTSTQNTELQRSVSLTRIPTIIHDEEVTQYLGNRGILSNIYGAELVDIKWLLYGFIVSKIHRTFKRNILTDHIQLKSLHLGKDSGSVQSVLHHLFTASDAFITMPVKWDWISTDYHNELYHTHKSHFIPLLRGKSIWDQVIMIINKIGEHAERYNLIIYQIDESNNLRNQYLFAIIMALRFADQNSVFLLEIPQEPTWTTLDINVLGLCGMIFDIVYLTKYEIEYPYTILVCSDKKKNISTNMLLKKLIKILTESNSHCILAKNIFPQAWLSHVIDMQASPIEPVPFLTIINSLSGILRQNESPFILK